MSDKHHSSLDLHSTGGAPALSAGRDPLYRRARTVALVLVGVLVAGALATAGLRYARSRDLNSLTEVQAREYVRVTVAGEDRADGTVSLPGTMQGFIESPIYARTTGYVLRWNRDIGARVAKGETLAELDTPEVDQQLAQATAARAQAAASLELARTSAERWEHLRERDAVSQQELDERRSAYAQAQANLAAAEANVQRLRELEGFKHIVAPFAGVVARRNVDVGDLVDAGSSGGAARALFMLSQTDPLRVYVYVPQAYASAVHVGQTVHVSQPELPGRDFTGKVSNTAGAIDPATRTLQVEVLLANASGVLLPGAYVDVHLPAVSGAGILAPANALLFRAEGTQVAIVDADGRVHLRPVSVGRDFGKDLELLSGVRPGERIILNPADSIAEGDLVVVQPPAGGAGT